MLINLQAGLYLLCIINVKDYKLFLIFSTVFAKRDSRKETLLIIQCESGHLYSDLIACAHYKVHDVLDRAQRSSSMDSNSMTHVLFIVNLPSNLHNQCNFVGFQGDLWISLHLDELWPVDESNFDIHAISEYTMSEMFIGQKLNHPEHISPQHQRLHYCIHAAVSRLSSRLSNPSRAIERVRLLLDLIPKSSLHVSETGKHDLVSIGIKTSTSHFSRYWHNILWCGSSTHC